MITKNVRVDQLISYHGMQADLSDMAGGAYCAHQKITNELLHLKRLYIQLSEEQAFLLLQAKLIQRLHYLRSSTQIEMEERSVYITFLAKHAKVPRATVQGVYDEVKRYICGEQYDVSFQGFCFGMFFQAITTLDFELRYGITIGSMRDYLIANINYFETVGNMFTVSQRQVAIHTMIFLLGLLQ